MKKAIVFILALAMLALPASILALDFKVSALGSDGTYSGITDTGTIGATCAQWDVLYPRNVSGALQWFPYDADDGTYKTRLPGAIAVAACSSAPCSSAILLLFGKVRNSGWAMTTNQDEGAPVYASATAGGITLTMPAVPGDEVNVVGRVLEENIVYFNFNSIQLEVPAE